MRSKASGELAESGQRPTRQRPFMADCAGLQALKSTPLARTFDLGKERPTILCTQSATVEGGGDQFAELWEWISSGEKRRLVFKKASSLNLLLPL
jgi:hypothetical protein